MAISKDEAERELRALIEQALECVAFVKLDKIDAVIELFEGALHTLEGGSSGGASSAFSGSSSLASFAPVGSEDDSLVSGPAISSSAPAVPDLSDDSNAKVLQHTPRQTSLVRLAVASRDTAATVPPGAGSGAPVTTGGSSSSAAAAAASSTPTSGAVGGANAGGAGNSVSPGSGRAFVRPLQAAAATKVTTKDVYESPSLAGRSLGGNARASAAAPSSRATSGMAAAAAAHGGSSSGGFGAGAGVGSMGADMWGQPPQRESSLTALMSQATSSIQAKHAQQRQQAAAPAPAPAPAAAAAAAEIAGGLGRAKQRAGSADLSGDESSAAAAAAAAAAANAAAGAGRLGLGLGAGTGGAGAIGGGVGGGNGGLARTHATQDYSSPRVSGRQLRAGSTGDASAPGAAGVAQSSRARGGPGPATAHFDAGSSGAAASAGGGAGVGLGHGGVGVVGGGRLGLGLGGGGAAAIGGSALLDGESASSSDHEREGGRAGAPGVVPLGGEVAVAGGGSNGHVGGLNGYGPRSSERGIVGPEGSSMRGGGSSGGSSLYPGSPVAQQATLQQLLRLAPAQEGQNLLGTPKPSFLKRLDSPDVRGGELLAKRKQLTAVLQRAMVLVPSVTLASYAAVKDQFGSALKVLQSSLVERQSERDLAAQQQAEE